MSFDFSINNYNVQTGTGAWLGLWKPGVFIESSVQSLEKEISQRFKFAKIDRLILAVLLSISVCVYIVDSPDAVPVVISEEAWLGKAVSYYMKGQFFISLPGFPYLSAQLLYPFMKWFGYDGNFPFIASGIPYDLKQTELPYELTESYTYPFLVSRLLARSISIMNPLLTYSSLKAFGISTDNCLLGGLFVIFENTFLTSSRYSLATTLNLSIIIIYNYVRACFIFRPNSFVCLLLLGICCGFSSAVGEAGTPLLVLTLGELFYRTWWIIADCRNSYCKSFFKLLVKSMILCLLTVITFTFSVSRHIWMTPTTGPDDRIMSGRFQSSLHGNGLSPEGFSVPRAVLYGNVVSLRHRKSHLILHSHPLLYEVGSGQQQVTAVDMYDSDCFWYLEKAYIEEGEPAPHTSDPAAVTSSNLVRLLHSQTMRRLHSHNISAPITLSDMQYEVSCYGAEKHPGDANDIWIVETVDPEFCDLIYSCVFALESSIRLRHSLLGCYLITHKTKLPLWAYDQMEVTCAFNPTPEASIWSIEYNMRSSMSGTDDMVSYPAPSVFEKGDECLEVVKELKSTYAPTVVTESKMDNALMLPLLTNPEILVMWGKSTGLQVGYFGNIAVWGCSFIALSIYILSKVLLCLSMQCNKGPRLKRISVAVKYDHNLGRCFFGWLVLFVGLFFLKTELRLSTYMPCLYMAIVAFINMWDFLLQYYELSRRVRRAAQFLIISLVIKNYFDCRPLSVGLDWSREACQSAGLGIWDFNCDIYDTETVNNVAYEAERFREEHMGYVPSDFFEGKEGMERIATSQSYAQKLITVLEIPEDFAPAPSNVREVLGDVNTS